MTTSDPRAAASRAADPRAAASRAVDPRAAHGNAFVWVWLPGAAEPVVAGKLIDSGPVVTFAYGRSYLARSDAVALYLPELPLRRGEIAPRSGEIASCVADAAPDDWGRRAIELRRNVGHSDLSIVEYLLESGSDRIGVLDFQRSAVAYRARVGDAATLEELMEAADRVESGMPLTPALDRALLHGISVGGARPKAVLTDGGRRMIAKFASVSDPYPMVKAEYAAMELARRVGIDAAPVRLVRVSGKDVLIVGRFDRTGETGRRIPRRISSVGAASDRTGETGRRMMVSALTVLELHDADGIAGRYAAYTDLVHAIRARFTAPRSTLHELFARITFNILVGNTDDHARNHSAFWDGAHLTLTPAYDICPQPRTGGEAAQAMAFGPDGDRLSQVVRCVTHASHYHLTTSQAREIIDRQIAVIHDEWDEVRDLAAMDRR